MAFKHFVPYTLFSGAIAYKLNFDTVYVVFGATGGIGSSLSKRLARQDQASVVLVGRDQGKLDALKSELGPSATTLLADVTDSKQVSLHTTGSHSFVW
jgi:NADP-dependent 3-hydroxy acid dehydrogenase YdfG